MDQSQSTDSSLESVEDIITHFGVRGQKWGVRRKSSGGSSSDPKTSTTVVRAVPGQKLKGSGGHFLAPSEDAIKTAISKQKAKASSTDALHTKDLQELVTRMNLEQQYTKLTTETKQKSAGRKFAETILLGIAKEEATKLAKGKNSDLLSAILGQKSAGKHRKK